MSKKTVSYQKLVKLSFLNTILGRSFNGALLPDV